jgi:hypothetical protein
MQGLDRRILKRIVTGNAGVRPSSIPCAMSAIASNRYERGDDLVSPAEVSVALSCAHDALDALEKAFEMSAPKPTQPERRRSNGLPRDRIRIACPTVTPERRRNQT